MNIAHLVVMMADCTSETWYSLANDASSRPTVLYRPEIYAVLAEIPHMCHFAPCGIFTKTLPRRQTQVFQHHRQLQKQTMVIRKAESKNYKLV